MRYGKKIYVNSVKFFFANGKLIQTQLAWLSHNCVVFRDVVNLRLSNHFIFLARSIDVSFFRDRCNVLHICRCLVMKSNM
jgi:hypothetical protein